MAEPTTEMPPIRPRVEQLGEKVGAILLIGLVVGLFANAVLAKRSLDLGAMADVSGDLVRAAGFTLLLTTLAYFGGMGLGFLIGWTRTSKRIAVRAPATVWVESFRGTPLFVQLLLIFALFSKYNPGDLDFPTRVFVTGVLALLLNTSGYQAEIFRAGFQSVGEGQIEAARSIGLDPRGTMRFVVLPQAVRLVVPPLLNEFVALLKASSLLAIVSVKELTYQAKIATSFGQPWLEIYIVVTALYLLMIIPLSKVVGYLERRFRIPGLGLQREASGRRTRRAPSATARALGADSAVLRAPALKIGANARRLHNVLTRRPVASREPW